jgi:hypothetical protein
MEGFKALVEIDRPFAGNIVGDFDILDLATFEILGNNIVSINIARLRLAQFSVR